MVRHIILKAVEPKMGDLRKNLALARDAVGQHDVKRADAV